MSHRSLFAFTKASTLYIIRSAGRAMAGLIAASALAGCGGAAPPTPVRIIVPPTRTPAVAVPVLVSTAVAAPPIATPQPTAQPTVAVEARSDTAETARLPMTTSTPTPVPSQPSGGAASANKAAPTPRPTATPRASTCVQVTFDELRKKGPRPPALETLSDGACVSVRFASGDETRYVWHPAGARFAPGTSMYVRWKDGLVSVFRKDGVLKTNEFYRGRQQELALLHEDGKYKLPASGSFIFSIDGDSLVVGLVDTLIRAR